MKQSYSCTEDGYLAKYEDSEIRVLVVMAL